MEKSKFTPAVKYVVFESFLIAIYVNKWKGLYLP